MWTISPLLPLMAPGMSPVPTKLCCFPYVIWMWGLRSLQSNRISPLVLVPFNEATLNFWDAGKDTSLRGNMPNIHIHLYICYSGKPVLSGGQQEPSHPGPPGLGTATVPEELRGAGKGWEVVTVQIGVICWFHEFMRSLSSITLSNWELPFCVLRLQSFIWARSRLAKPARRPRQTPKSSKKP